MAKETRTKRVVTRVTPDEETLLENEAKRTGVALYDLAYQILKKAIQSDFKYPPEALSYDSIERRIDTLEKQLDSLKEKSENHEALLCKICTRLFSRTQKKK